MERKGWIVIADNAPFIRATPRLVADLKRRPGGIPEDTRLFSTRPDILAFHAGRASPGGGPVRWCTTLITNIAGQYLGWKETEDKHGWITRSEWHVVPHDQELAIYVALANARNHALAVMDCTALASLPEVEAVFPDRVWEFEIDEADLARGIWR